MATTATSSWNSKQASKAYDVEMIRDFLDQLSAEVRGRKEVASVALRTLEETESYSLADLEACTARRELAGVLSRFHDKYGTVLIPEPDIYVAHLPEERKVAAMSWAYSLEIKGCEKLLQQLEELSGLFEDALLLANVPVESKDEDQDEDEDDDVSDEERAELRRLLSPTNE